jgi:hypothetical protein
MGSEVACIKTRIDNLFISKIKKLMPVTNYGCDLHVGYGVMVGD